MTTARPDTLHAVMPGDRDWPIFDVAATRRIERAALAAAPAHALMRRAGLAVARLVLATQPGARHVHAVAGPGNNGGDALVAATWLQRCGWRVNATLLADETRLPDDARQALADARSAGVAVSAALPDRFDAGVLIDGLLGIGATRAPYGPIAAAIDLLNASGCPVIAVDLPSGLDADRGVRLGPRAVHAAETLSLLTLKPGLFTAQGRDHVGRVWLDDLDVTVPETGDRLLGAPQLRASPHAVHKGSFGDVCVVGGDRGMTGAAALAARAGLMAGAGRVYVNLLDPGSDVELHWPELMRGDTDALVDPKRLAERTLVAGCGGGAAIRNHLPPLLAHATRLVLDADALNAIAAEAALATALRARAGRGRPSVLTPHPLEAARLLGIEASQVQADRPSCARELARRFDAVVVLKGSGTVIASPDGRIAINPTGHAVLAAPGTGDVLAGWIGGAWSRAGQDAKADSVAAAAVWRHGRAADRWARGRIGLRAGELALAMRDLDLRAPA